MSTKKRIPRRIAEKKPPPRIAASQSFTEDEVKWLEQVMRIMLRGGDPKALLRHRETFASLARKVQAMRRRVESVKAQRAALDRPSDTP